MSSSRHHIPFPANFLSLNTPLKKASPNGTDAVASPRSDVSHSFLSNQPHHTPRQASISSVGSVESVDGDAPVSPTTSEAAPSPELKHVFPAFTPLALNTKHVPAPVAGKETNADKASSFLSNRA